MPGVWIGLVVGLLKDGKQGDGVASGEDTKSGGGDKNCVRDQGKESLGAHGLQKTC